MNIIHRYIIFISLVSSSHSDTGRLSYPKTISVTVHCDGKDTNITGTTVGVGIPVLIYEVQ